MQVSIETTSGLERRLTVGVPSEKVESEINARLQKAAKTVRLDGFRPGKVPFKVIKQRFGQGVRQEVVGEIIGNSFYEAVAQEKVKPAGQPNIEPKVNESGKDLEYVATFEVYPEITLADASALAITRPVAEVQDDDVTKMIEVLRQQQAKWQEVDREAKDGDQVNLDYTGEKDGEAFDGGSAEGSDLVIGSNRMIPGFEDALVGMKAGDEKKVPLQFPDDYHSEELKGAQVEFTLKVNSVDEKVLPELNEEFFAIFGEQAGDEEAFRQDVRNNMERELKNALQNKFKTRILEQFCKLHEVDVPAALVAGEISALKRQMFSQMGGNQNFDESMLPDDLFKEQAEKRVFTGLIVNEIITVNELKADNDRVRAKIEEVASTYESPEEVVQYYYGNQQLLDGVEAAVLEEQVVEFLEQSANVTDEDLSYEEALKPDEPEPAEQADQDEPSKEQ